MAWQQDMDVMDTPPHRTVLYNRARATLDRRLPAFGYEIAD